MVVKRDVVDDDWPDNLWYYELSGFRDRHEWLLACMHFAQEHGLNALAVNRLMINRRPLGTELAMELSPECRQRVRPPRRNGWSLGPD
jgi:hypothetical protein